MCLKALSLFSFLVAINCGMTIREKRELFREELLPQYGGKIPESAFFPERLVLNKLNQNGFYTIDGVILEHGSPDVRSAPKKYPTPTVKIAIGADKKYKIASEALYNSRIVDTTYLIRKPINFNAINLNLISYSQLPIMTKRKKNNSLDDKEIQIIFKDLQPYLKKLHSYD